MLGVFLSALVARTYQSETQSKVHSKILLDRLKIYQEAQAVAFGVGFPKKHTPVIPYSISNKFADSIRTGE
jgi:hypothetical protein